METTKNDNRAGNSTNPLPSLDACLRHYLNKANKDANSLNDACLDPQEIEEITGKPFKHPYKEYKETLEFFLDRINEAIGHTCEYNEDDYCIVCGNDGRA